MAFRKSALIWRATYSGLEENRITHVQIRDQVLAAFGEKRPWFVIGKELHPTPEDPEKPWHYHLHLQFPAKAESENPRILDVDGVHPAIRGRFGPCYAAKDGDYITNRTDEDAWRPAPRVDVLKPKFAWQLELVDRLSSEPDRTTIHWYWEPSGGVGKTQFFKWACVTGALGEAIVVGGRATDMKHAVAKMVEARKPPRVVFVGLVRDQAPSYPGIEAVKDGIFFSAKYDSGMVTFNSPHLVVFSNAPPDESRLSTHKWHIVKIDKSDLE